jgi:hypothetical protein
MANIAQTINVLQAMLLTDGEKMIRTPTYHVFAMYTVHHDATLLPTELTGPDYALGGDTIPGLSVSASRDAAGVIHVSLANLHPAQPVVVAAELRGARPRRITGRVLTADSAQAKHFDQRNGQPSGSMIATTDGGFTVNLRRNPWWCWRCPDDRRPDFPGVFSATAPGCGRWNWILHRTVGKGRRGLLIALAHQQRPVQSRSMSRRLQAADGRSVCGPAAAWLLPQPVKPGAGRGVHCHPVVIHAGHCQPARAGHRFGKSHLETLPRAARTAVDLMVPPARSEDRRRPTPNGSCEEMNPNGRVIQNAGRVNATSSSPQSIPCRDLRGGGADLGGFSALKSMD